MFYCKSCAKKNNWPQSLFKSHGLCELCGKIENCNDIPSSQLPEREKLNSNGEIIN